MIIIIGGFISAFCFLIFFMVPSRVETESKTRDRVEYKYGFLETFNFLKKAIQFFILKD